MALCMSVCLSVRPSVIDYLSEVSRYSLQLACKIYSSVYQCIQYYCFSSMLEFRAVAVRVLKKLLMKYLTRVIVFEIHSFTSSDSRHK